MSNITELQVVSIQKRQEEEVIAELQRLLDLAKEGIIEGFVVLSMWCDGTNHRATAGKIEYAKLIGVLEMMKHKVLSDIEFIPDEDEPTPTPSTPA